jgi:hypothetical protein
MSVLRITEFNNPWFPFGLPAEFEPPVAEQTIAITGTSAPSQTFNAATNFVRLHTDVVCCIAFGTAPVAQDTASTEHGSNAVGTQRMAAGQTMYKNVKPGSGLQVAVITAA